MPPVFQPRTPTQAPLDLEAEIAAIEAGQLDIKKASQAAIDAIAAGSSRSPGNPNSAIGSEELALYEQEQEDATRQQEYENVLAMVELMNSEEGGGQVIDDRAPPMGGVNFDFSGDSEVAASTLGHRMGLASNYDAMMRQRDQASLDANPVQMSGPSAGGSLEEKFARARTLLDLLNGGGAGAITPGMDASGLAPAGPVQGPMLPPEGTVPGSPSVAGGNEQADLMDFISRLIKPPSFNSINPLRRGG